MRQSMAAAAAAAAVGNDEIGKRENCVKENNININRKKRKRETCVRVSRPKCVHRRLPVSHLLRLVCVCVRLLCRKLIFVFDPTFMIVCNVHYYYFHKYSTVEDDNNNNNNKSR